MPDDSNEFTGDGTEESRRNYLKQIGATGAATTIASLSGCIDTLMGGGGSGTMTFGTWGGTFQELMIDAVIEPYQEEYDAEVEYVLGRHERMSSVIGSGDNPPVDVGQNRTEQMVRGSNAGVLHNLSDNVEIYDTIPDMFKGDNYLVQHFTGSGITYNTNTFDSPPSMEVYLDPEYEGRVTLSSPEDRSPNYDLMAFSLYQTDGETHKDIDAAFEMYEEVVAEMDPSFVSATEEWGSMFDGDEIDVARTWASRAASWNDQGLPTEYVLPDEGAMIYSAGTYIPENIPDDRLENAAALVDYQFTEEASVMMAEEMYYPTTNPEIEYPDSVAERIPLMDDVDSMIMPDMEWMTENQSDWTDRALDIVREYN